MMRAEYDALQTNFLDTRNWVLFNILIREKLSVRAALGLKVGDIDLDTGAVRLPRKTVPLKAETLDTLRYYLHTFTWLDQPESVLFPSRSGKRIFASNYRYKILEPAVQRIDPDLQLTAFHPAKLPVEIRSRLLINPNEVKAFNPTDALLCKLEI
jgi:integrase